MTNKRTKIFDCLCVVLAVVALILECLPNSVRVVICLDGHYRYITRWYSYFNVPFDSGFVTNFTIGILTILKLIFGIILIIKSNKNIRIFNLILNVLVFSADIRYIAGDMYLGVYEIILPILFFIQMFIGFASLDISARGSNKKVTILNYLDIIAVGAAMVLQLIPTSLHIVEKFNYKQYSLSETWYSYFDYSKNWMLLLGVVVAFFTFYTLMFGLITLTRDKKGLCIIQLTTSSVSTLLSGIILIMAGSSYTPYNVVIMLLLMAAVVIQSVKLKTFYNEVDKRLT